MEQSEREVQELVEQAMNGQSNAVGSLFDLLNERVFWYIRLRVSDTETAEDITQTVFLEMIRSLPRYRPSRRAKFSTWLFQIARHRLIDHYRRQEHRKQTSLDDVPESRFSVEPQAPGELSDVDRCIQTLSERYQTVLHLRYREDMDFVEIGRVMEITSTNARVLHHRALNAMKDAFHPTTSYAEDTPTTN